MLDVHNTCDQWQNLSCALSIASTSDSTPIVEGIDNIKLRASFDSWFVLNQFYSIVLEMANLLPFLHIIIE
jgi:hypothetical protein